MLEFFGERGVEDAGVVRVQRQRVVEREEAADVRVVGIGLQAQRDQVGCGAHLDGGSAAGLLQLQQLQAHTYACSSSGIVCIHTQNIFFLTEHTQHRSHLIKMLTLQEERVSESFWAKNVHTYIHTYIHTSIGRS